MRSRLLTHQQSSPATAVNNKKGMQERPSAHSDQGASDAAPAERRSSARVQDDERTGRGSASALSRLKMLDRKVLGKVDG
jgi:hypothetical protein